jgi:predicted phosphodiesterase
MQVLIITDIHANLEALEAVVDAAASSSDEVWCLGDIVGYGPEPREALAAVRKLRPITVAGNHDRGVSGKLSLDDFSEGARDALERHMPLLTGAEKEWLDALPEVKVQSGVTLCHGSLVDPVWAYILSEYDAAVNLRMATTNLVFTGHTHFPALWQEKKGGRVSLIQARYDKKIRLRGKRAVVNPGSLGQPRNGRPAAHCAIYDTEDQSIIFRQVPYPFETTMEKMRQAGYPDSSIARYAQGR